MEKLIIVSGDGHIGPPVKDYEQYLDPKYRHLMPQLLQEEEDLRVVMTVVDLKTPERLQAIDPRNRILGGGYEDGGANVTRRLEELDAEGIAAEVVLPGSGWTGTPFFYQFNRVYPDDVRMAGVRAYHRWLADAMVPAKGRLLCTAEPGPARDINEAISEVRFCAEHGFRGVYVPGQLKVAGAPPIYDPHYEPFWAACNDMGLVLTVHVGFGGEQGPFTDIVKEVKKYVQEGPGKGFGDGWEKVISMMDEENPMSMFSQNFNPRQVIWQIIFSGLFDRYPNLKLQVAEARADWVPELKLHLNKRFFLAKDRPNLKMKPSEYFGRNVFVTPSSPKRVEVELRDEIGVDTFMFGGDFPHPESTWPNTLNWMQATFYDVSEADLRAMVGGNAIRAYGLDRDELAKIAARIGPSPSDILGDHKVDERIIADFNMRANFSNEPMVLDGRDLERRVSNDLAAMAAGRAAIAA
jgi:predicted TIM-barrel fold metal-dependent hydrolase